MTELSAAAIALLRAEAAGQRVGYVEGFADGVAAIREASYAISAGLDWKAEATSLGDAERARRVRAEMLAPGVRVGDYMGRGRRRATAVDVSA
jgi:hypothetical protein